MPFFKRKYKPNAQFEACFRYLKETPFAHDHGKETYHLLSNLEVNTSDAELQELISSIKNLRFGSKTNSVFYFYFPIVSYVLHHKPEAEAELLGYLVGPNFANGTYDAPEMIHLIIGAMDYKLKQEEFFLTAQSQDWILNVLPSMEREIKREIDQCERELDEI